MRRAWPVVLLALLWAPPARATSTATAAITSSSALAANEEDEPLEDPEPDSKADEVSPSELPLLDTVPPDERSGLLPPLTPPLPGARADVMDPDEPLEIGKREMERDDLLDASAAEELLDAVKALDGTTVPVWPEPGPVTYDIPMADDKRVDMWIQYFRGAGRGHFQVYMSRLTRYAPIFWPILAEHGLPKDTIFLAMIESGFSTRATSWAAAAGPWQFVPDTARRYGLEVGFWVDDRRDFERATIAACLYLKALHDEFGDWMLAWAAYNTGEGRIRYAVKRTGSSDFWTISRTGLLYRETKHYVPKLIAAALMAKQPQAYDVLPEEYLPELRWETITVTTAIDLATVARACGPRTRTEELETLNPALYRGVTPPREYELRVPAGLRTACAMGLSSMPPTQRLTYRVHRIRPKDSVDSLAKAYFTTADAILKFNHLENPKQLGNFDAMIIPVPESEAGKAPPGEDMSSWRGFSPSTPLTGANVGRIHRVVSGDTLWKIARRYGVSLGHLTSINGLSRGRRLRIGQQIRIQ
ncbi:MAG: LysM peptidoglycan-binding domain-containing protein [Myxococcota bacterium]